MPVAQIISMAKKAGVSPAKAEDLWDQAKASAKDQDHEDDYPYIMGIFKRMLKGHSKESVVLNILSQFENSEGERHA